MPTSVVLIPSANKVEVRRGRESEENGGPCYVSYAIGLGSQTLPLH